MRGFVYISLLVAIVSIQCLSVDAFRKRGADDSAAAHFEDIMSIDFGQALTSKPKLCEALEVMTRRPRGREDEAVRAEVTAKCNNPSTTLEDIQKILEHFDSDEDQ